MWSPKPDGLESNLKEDTWDFFSHICTGKAGWGHREKAARYKPGRGLTRNQPWWHLCLGLSAYRTVRKEISTYVCVSS